MADKTVGDVLSAAVDDQLQEERQLKDSLTQRSTIVISTSGTLVTLSLGAAALVTRKQSFTVPHGMLVIVAAAVAILVVAALVSLLVNGSWKQGSIPVNSLDGTNYHAAWATIDNALTIGFHDIRLELIAGLRKANKQRARLLMIALILECIAVALLAVGTLQTLLGASVP